MQRTSIRRGKTKAIKQEAEKQIETPPKEEPVEYVNEEHRFQKGKVVIIAGFFFEIDHVRRQGFELKPMMPYTYANGVIVISKKVVKKNPEVQTGAQEGVQEKE